MEDRSYQLNSVFPNLWGASWQAVLHITQEKCNNWTVVNLMGEFEKEWSGYIKPNCIVLEYPDTYLAIDEQKYDYILNIVDKINNNLLAGSKVAVHCRQGIDRTSYVLGAYLYKYKPQDKHLSAQERKKKIVDDLRQNYHGYAFRNKDFIRSFISMPGIV